MWISKKRFKSLEKKVADLECNQSQLIEQLEINQKNMTKKGSTRRLN